MYKYCFQPIDCLEDLKLLSEKGGSMYKIVQIDHKKDYSKILAETERRTVYFVDIQGAFDIRNVLDVEKMTLGDIYKNIDKGGTFFYLEEVDE